MTNFFLQLHYAYLKRKYTYTITEDLPDGRLAITKEHYSELIDHEHCAECGGWAPVDAKFCPRCGAVFVSQEDKEIEEWEAEGLSPTYEYEDDDGKCGDDCDECPLYDNGCPYSDRK